MAMRLVIIVSTMRARAPLFVVPLSVAVITVTVAIALTVPVILDWILTPPTRRRATVLRLTLFTQTLLLRV